MSNVDRHAEALRAHRVSLPDRSYHIIKCIDERCRPAVDLSGPRLGEIVSHALVHQRNRHGCRLFAFVVMPDHFHWFFCLPDGASLANRLKVICNWTAREINRELGRRGRLWQRDGFYDRILRDNEKAAGLTAYIEGNPMRKDLCALAEEWPWSSAHSRWKPFLDRDWFGPERW